MRGYALAKTWPGRPAVPDRRLKLGGIQWHQRTNSTNELPSSTHNCTSSFACREPGTPAADEAMARRKDAVSYCPSGGSGSRLRIELPPRYPAVGSTKDSLSRSRQRSRHQPPHSPKGTAREASHVHTSTPRSSAANPRRRWRSRRHIGNNRRASLLDSSPRRTDEDPARDPLHQPDHPVHRERVLVRERGERAPHHP